MKIDRRKKFVMVLDTETCPVDKSLEKVIPYNMFCYDIGWAVTDKKGNIYAERSFVIYEIFCEEKRLMRSAYYAEKIPMYWENIKAGKRELRRWSTIYKQFREDIAAFGINEFYAHNAAFDVGALNNTVRWLTKSKRRYFFPKNSLICDTLMMARSVISNKPTYKKFCAENNYLTAQGRVRLTAEILYRYISGNNDFCESHTGLEDVRVEVEIMVHCINQHKTMKRVLYPKGYKSEIPENFKKRG